MFDLEQAIADWRKQIVAAGIKRPTTLDELENHLREEFEWRVKSGANPQCAFEIAAEKVGQPLELKIEFKKVPEPLETRFVKLAGIACGTVAGFFSLWSVYNLLFIHEVNWAVRIVGLFAIAAIGSSWRYGGRLLPTIRNQKVRAAGGLLCCAAGVGGMVLFIKLVLPSLFDVPVRTAFPIARLLICFLAAWTAMAILAAITFRLAETADEPEGRHV